MAFTEDLTEFFDTDDHAVSATYTPSGGGGSTINVIFNNEFFAIDNGVGVESSQPVATCKTSDVSSAAHGDTLAISGTTYNVVGVHNDGTGVTTLILENQ